MNKNRNDVSANQEPEDGNREQALKIATEDLRDGAEAVKEAVENAMPESDLNIDATFAEVKEILDEVDEVFQELDSIDTTDLDAAAKQLDEEALKLEGIAAAAGVNINSELENCRNELQSIEEISGAAPVEPDATPDPLHDEVAAINLDNQQTTSRAAEANVVSPELDAQQVTQSTKTSKSKSTKEIKQLIEELTSAIDQQPIPSNFIELVKRFDIAVSKLDDSVLNDKKLTKKIRRIQGEITSIYASSFTASAVEQFRKLDPNNFRNVGAFESTDDNDITKLIGLQTLQGEYIIDDILSYTSPELRRAAIERYLFVTNELLSTGNYFSAKALYLSLTDNRISSLYSTVAPIDNTVNSKKHHFNNVDLTTKAQEAKTYLDSIFGRETNTLLNQLIQDHEGPKLPQLDSISAKMRDLSGTLEKANIALDGLVSERNSMLNDDPKLPEVISKISRLEETIRDVLATASQLPASFQSMYTDYPEQTNIGGCAALKKDVSLESKKTVAQYAIMKEQLERVKLQYQRNDVPANPVKYKIHHEAKQKLETLSEGIKSFEKATNAKVDVYKAERIANGNSTKKIVQKGFTTPYNVVIPPIYESYDDLLAKLGKHLDKLSSSDSAIKKDQAKLATRVYHQLRLRDHEVPLKTKLQLVRDLIADEKFNKHSRNLIGVMRTIKGTDTTLVKRLKEIYGVLMNQYAKANVQLKDLKQERGKNKLLLIGLNAITRDETAERYWRSAAKSMAIPATIKEIKSILASKEEDDQTKILKLKKMAAPNDAATNTLVTSIKEYFMTGDLSPFDQIKDKIISSMPQDPQKENFAAINDWAKPQIPAAPSSEGNKADKNIYDDMDANPFLVADDKSNQPGPIKVNTIETDDLSRIALRDTSEADQLEEEKKREEKETAAKQNEVDTIAVEKLVRQVDNAIHHLTTLAPKEAAKLQQVAKNIHEIANDDTHTSTEKLFFTARALAVGFEDAEERERRGVLFKHSHEEMINIVNNGKPNQHPSLRYMAVILGDALRTNENLLKEFNHVSGTKHIAATVMKINTPKSYKQYGELIIQLKEMGLNEQAITELCNTPQKALDDAIKTLHLSERRNPVHSNISAAINQLRGLSQVSEEQGSKKPDIKSP